MPHDKLEKEVENGFKIIILIPVIQYLEVFINTQHNLSPDEFLKTIYVPEKTRSTRCSRVGHNPDFSIGNPSKITPQELQIPPVPLQQPIAQLFFEIIRLRPFLLNVFLEFRKRRNRRCLINVSQTIALTYVLIYRTSINFISDAIECLIYFNVSKILPLMSFLLTPKLSSWFYVTASHIFDIDFVEKRIFQPFVNALPIIEIIYANLIETNKRLKPLAKKITIPIEMNVLKHPRKFPAPPVCTPENAFKIPIKPVPKTLYKTPEIESKIARLRAKHRVEAAQRFEDANTKAPACFNSNRSKRYQRVVKEINEMNIKSRLPIVGRKIPTFKSVVPVKKTVATILREAAFIANSEVKEVEKLKDLTKGSFDPAEIQRLEEEMRQSEKEENLRKIEEKHLSGLISYEESLLAKQRLLKDAKEQGDKVRSEREKLNAKLERFRIEETEKLKRMVEKCHDANKAVKNSYNFMVHEKREKAAEVAEESERIKLYLIEKQEEELRRKLQIIHEIRTFQTSQSLRIKDFDPTETSKLGLMCEMSLAELKEKLSLVKAKWQDELMTRKQAIRARRQKQKDFVKSTQKTIDEYRVSKQAIAPPGSVACVHPQILQTPELEALRRKLEKRRIERLQMIKPPSTNVIFKSKLLSSTLYC